MSQIKLCTAVLPYLGAVTYLLQFVTDSLFSRKHLFMILITSGRGYVVLFIWLVCTAFFALVFQLNGFDAFVPGVMVSSTLSSLLGWYWKKKAKEKAASGKLVKKRRDCFFFVPLEYTWVIGLAIVVFSFIVTAMDGTLYF